MPFSQNLIYCMNQRGYSAYRLAKVLGVNNQSTVNWMEGKNVPHPKTRQKIADHFGITVAELDGDELPVLPPDGTKKAPESTKKEPATLPLMPQALCCSPVMREITSRPVSVAGIITRCWSGWVSAISRHIPPAIPTPAGQEKTTWPRRSCKRSSAIPIIPPPQTFMSTQMPPSLSLPWKPPPLPPVPLDILHHTGHSKLLPKHSQFLSDC